MARTHALQRFHYIGPALALSASLAALAMPGTARAQTVPTVRYFFSSSDTAFVPITTEQVAAGGAFTVSIFYTATGFTANGDSFNSMDLFVGFDHSTSYGTGATPTDNRLTLGDGDDPNAAVTTDPGASGFDELFPGVNDLTGGQPSGGGSFSRPYGDDIALALDPGAVNLQDVSTPTHLVDILFKNADLAAGPETISIYNGGTGVDSTTYVTDGTTEYRPTTVNLLLSQIPGGTSVSPEPSALVLLVGGCLVPLAGLVRKRRRS